LRTGKLSLPQLDGERFRTHGKVRGWKTAVGGGGGYGGMASCGGQAEADISRTQLLEGDRSRWSNVEEVVVRPSAT
jgi:hypothetical protein